MHSFTFPQILFFALWAVVAGFACSDTSSASECLTLDQCSASCEKKLTQQAKKLADKDTADLDKNLKTWKSAVDGQCYSLYQATERNGPVGFTWKPCPSDTQATLHRRIAAMDTVISQLKFRLHMLQSGPAEKAPDAGVHKWDNGLPTLGGGPLK